MEYVVNAVSCFALDAISSFKIVEKYGKKLSKFDVKIKWDSKEALIKEKNMPNKKLYKGIDITYLPETTISLMKELSDEELEKNKPAIDLENYAWSLVQGFDEKTAIYLEAAVLTGYHFEKYKNTLNEKDIAQKTIYLRDFYEGEGFVVDYDKMIEYIEKGKEVYHILND